MPAKTMGRLATKRIDPPKDTDPLDISFEVVDATTAAEWLERNKSNRPIRRNKVLEFKRDMLSGNWRDVGDPVRFDTNDDLIDAQHRMTALVEADKERPGISFQFIVVRGVKPEDRHTIDIGIRRSVGDQLKMAGYTNYHLLAGAARWCVMWDKRVVEAQDKSVKSVTHAEILDYCEDNPMLIDIVARTRRYLKLIDMPGGYIAASYFIFSRIDPGLAEEFFERVADGVGLGKEDPILALRSRLRQLDKTNAHLPGERWLSLVFRTWNAWREERTLKMIPVDKNGAAIPIPDPV